jgi:HAD superfamily hydrolase (TIGR01549 family)
MKIKAVFFDAGETLIFRNPSLSTLAARQLRSGGIKIPKSILVKAISAAAAEMKPIVERGVMSDSKKWKVYVGSVFKKLRIKNPALEEKLRLRLKNGTSFKAFGDAHKVVDYLNGRGIKTGIISNAPKELENILKRVKLYGKFRHIVISENAGVEKPHKKIFLKALKLARSKAHETVYIGDNYVADIYGAKNAGLVPVWIRRKSKNAEFSFAGGKNDMARTVTSLSGLIKLMKKEAWL